MYQSTESGKPSIVPGSRKKSEIFQRITNHDPEYRMPQDASPLTEAQIELIGKWIDQGAKWETHWAFVPPEAQQIPATNSEWPNNSIDAFILDKLNSVGFGTPG